MADEIQHLTKGQSDWQVPVNQLIDQYADLEGETPTVSDWTKDGIVLLNGTTWQDNCKGYRIAQFKNFKLVQLDLKLTGTNTTSSSQKLLDLPSSISLDQMSTIVGCNMGIPGIGVAFAVTTLTNTGVTQTLVSPNVPTNGWTPNPVVETTYLCTL